MRYSDWAHQKDGSKGRMKTSRSKDIEVFKNNFDNKKGIL